MFGFARKSNNEVSIPSNEATRAFDVAWKDPSVREIPFESHWRGTLAGYRYEGFLDLKEGEVVKSLDPEKKIRLVMIGTFFGPVGLCDRFEHGRHVGFWVDLPDGFPRFLAMSLDMLPFPSAIGVRNLVGDGTGFVMNIGQVLNKTILRYQNRAYQLAASKSSE